MIAPAPRGWFRVVALTSEWDGYAWIPTVRHEMYGATRERALEVFAAHMQSDAFLRGCTTRQSYEGTTCRTESIVEQIP
jgi:hypothetical protein